MNKIELVFYNIFRKNLKIKNIVRNLYQSLFDILPDKDNFFLHRPIVKENCFFGFHDSTPFSNDNTKVLSNKLLIPLRMPMKNDALEVGYWDGELYTNWRSIDKTYAWNYHKGCRLQWLKQDESVIYNIWDGISLKSKIFNLLDQRYYAVDYPIDSTDNKGNFATSFSYERLQNLMPGYGYDFSDEAYLNEKISGKTGMYLVDINRNERKLLISLKDLAGINFEESMNDSFHFVTHSLFSPDGNYVSFFHRWYKGQIRNTRLVIYDIRNDRFFISPTNGMVSHYVWNKLNGIIAYCRIENINSHVYFEKPSMESYIRVAYPELNSDGHQSFIDNENFLTDTYPDRRRYAKLYSVGLATNEARLIAEIKSFRKFQSKTVLKHWGCDLHPRSSNDGKYACFDSVHTNVRALCIMKIQ